MVSLLQKYLVMDLLRVPTRSSRPKVFCKKNVFLEISQGSQEITCARVSFLIKRLWHRCFRVNFEKFLRTPFLTECLPWRRLFSLSRCNPFSLNFALSIANDRIELTFRWTHNGMKDSIYCF